MIDIIKKNIFIIIFFSLFFSVFRSTNFAKELYVISVLCNIVIIVIAYKLFLNSLFHRRIFYFLTAFSLYALFTSLWSYNPAYSLFRAVFFMFLVFSSLLTGYLFSVNKVNIYKIFTYLNFVFILFALISLLLGIPADAWTANHGKGFMAYMAHQNTFAALLLFTSFGPICQLLFLISDKYYSKQLSLKQKKVNLYLVKFIVYATILLLNIYFIIVSHSRISVACMIAFLLFLPYLILNFKQKLYYTFSIIILFILLMFTPQITITIEKYLLKGYNGYFSTRSILWYPSLLAAQHGGLWGIGFSISDPTVITDYTKYNIVGELVREKGNSILAYVEEVGIIGLLLFSSTIFYFFYKSMKKIKTIRNIDFSSNSNQLIKIAVSVYFVILLLIHSQFEAWWVWLGSIYLQIFLILLSYYPVDNVKMK